MSFSTKVLIFAAATIFIVAQASSAKVYNWRIDREGPVDTESARSEENEVDTGPVTDERQKTKEELQRLFDVVLDEEENNGHPFTNEEVRGLERKLEKLPWYQDLARTLNKNIEDRDEGKDKRQVLRKRQEFNDNQGKYPELYE